MAARRHGMHPKTAAPQRFLGQFPTPTNREVFRLAGYRHYLTGNSVGHSVIATSENQAGPPLWLAGPPLWLVPEYSVAISHRRRLYGPWHPDTTTDPAISCLWASADHGRPRVRFTSDNGHRLLSCRCLLGAISGSGMKLCFRQLFVPQRASHT